MFRPISIFNRRPEPVLRGEEDYLADPFFRLQRDMNQLFDSAFAGYAPRSVFSPSDEARTPIIDVRETDDAFEVEAELPGVDEKDVDVQLHDNRLTIRGEKKFERNDEKAGSYRVTERAYGSFARSIALPFSVDADAVEATFKDGVLRLSVQKPIESRSETRRISINRS